MAKISAALLAAPTGLGGLPAAQAQYAISNPSGVVRNFDSANLGPVFSDLGLQWELSDINDDGTQAIRIVREGLIFFMMPAACRGANNTGWIGAQALALVESPAVAQQAINAFNISCVFTSTGPAPHGWYISRKDIVDFGIARGNIESSVKSFISLATMAYEAFSGSGSTVSREGFSGDLASARLNENSARAIGVSVRRSQGHAGADHLRETEAMPETIRAFAEKARKEDFNKTASIPQN
jgi:hypothetical protein